MEYKNNAIGGLGQWFDNFSFGDAWQASDTNGNTVNQDTHPNEWVSRTFDMSNYAGHTLAGLSPLKDVMTSAGSWDIWYSDIAITSADGTVTTIMGSNGQVSATGPECQGPSTNIGVEVQSAGTAPGIVGSGTDTHFYMGDHLGTAQMELAAAGWPVWAGQFAPFGGEIQNGATLPPNMPDGSANHYKFTGKERDAESGLDYFGARYYGSSMGRWMSPDWADKPEAVPYSSLGNPQSLNLYGYVGNNPLSQVDADGHEFDGGWNTKPGSDEFASGESLQDENHNSRAEIAHNGFMAAVNQSYADRAAAQQKSAAPAKPSMGSRILNAWLKLTSPIDKATAWTDEHPMVMAPLAIVAALEGNEGPVEEDEALVQSKAESAANAIRDWLGEGWSQVKSGSDLALRSADGTRRIRFDLLNSHGDAPHINVELWKMRNLYPGDQRWEQIFNKHIYPK